MAYFRISYKLIKIKTLSSNLGAVSTVLEGPLEKPVSWFKVNANVNSCAGDCDVTAQQWYTLQMFTGIYRDSAGVFLQYLQGKPCNIYRLQGKSVNVTGCPRAKCFF